MATDKTYHPNGETNRKTDFVGDPYLMDWIGRTLPDKFSFYVTDVDLVLRNREGALMLIEVKRKSAPVKRHQRTTLFLLDSLIREALYHRRTFPADGYQVTPTYYGLHLITFTNTTFEDGAVLFDRDPVTEEELAALLSFDPEAWRTD